MNSIDFNKHVESRVKKSLDVLITKAKEYAVGDDRLHNFRTASKLKKTTMSDACLGMALKHFVSIIDITNAVASKDALVTKDVLDEKFGDALNYLLLLEACLIEEMKERGHWK